MATNKPIHPDFLFFIGFKEKGIIDLFKDLRKYVLEIYPDSNELVYHTHALTTVFSISDKLSDPFYMIPIYTNHLHLGFNKGTLINDPHKLLIGTGNLIKHIPVSKPADYRNSKIKSLIKSAADFAIKDMNKPTTSICKSFSKIKQT
jgi:hypothetical protein